jgi:tetratricopeptide (TPR) repeat protein
MIVKDEEANLPLSLGPLAGLCDEAVVLDTGSRDGTIRLAKKLGARVFEAPWTNDFAAARNTALSYATTDYVMWLDADNSAEPQDFLRLKEIVSQRKAPRVLTMLELVVPQGDTLTQKRVFPKSEGVSFQGRIHEQLTHPKGMEVCDTGITVKHWGYENPAEAKRKGLRNLELLLSDPLTKDGDHYLLYQTGKTLLNLRRPEEALVWLKRAAAANNCGQPLWSHSLILASGIEARTEGPEAALKTLQTLARSRPDYGPGRYFLGKLLASRGRKKEAAAELALALKLGLSDPGWGAAPDKLGFTCAQLLGKILAEEGRHPEAKEAFVAAAAFAPGSPEPWAALAESEGALKNYHEAKRHLLRALRLKPRHRRAERLLAELGGNT